jgi:RNA polymerase sigma-70 factor, ECF subfamily
MREPMQVTELLGRWRAGDQQAASEVVPLVYAELHRIASVLMSREAQGHTLQPTALINEVFLRLVKDKAKNWADRGHFLAVAARAMRQILVDHARRHQRAKRGGEQLQVELSDGIAARTIDLDELIHWNDLLTDLEAMDPRSARIVELKWFAGLEGAEIASVLGISEKTVKRDWAVTRAWLKTRIKDRQRGDESTGMAESQGSVPPGA